MKNSYLTALLAVLIAPAAIAATEPSLTVFPNDPPTNGGLLPQCISPNGAYVCGSTYSQAMFTGVVGADAFKIYTEADGSSFMDFGGDLPAVNDNGIAVGFDDAGPAIIDVKTATITRPNLVQLSKNIAGGLFDAISENGIICGMAYLASDHSNAAAYWENNEGYLLPVPTQEELGFVIQGSRARCISADGSVIVGELIDALSTGMPMVIWKRQADGSYQIDPVCKKYFTDPRQPDYSKPFVEFRPQALSPDGKTVIMRVRHTPAQGKPVPALCLLAYYDIETDDITIANPSDGLHGIPEEISPIVYYHGLSNNGTAVGYFEYQGEYKSFIMLRDELDMYAPSALFETLDELTVYEEGYTQLSSISADGHLITGTAFTPYPQYGNNYFFQGYMIDTGDNFYDTGSIDAIGGEPADGPAEYYDLTGLRLNGPAKGINLVRQGGKTSKVIF